MKFTRLLVVLTSVYAQSSNLKNTILTNLDNGDTSDATSAIRYDDNTILITKKTGEIYSYSISKDVKTLIYKEVIEANGECGLLSLTSSGNTIWMYVADTINKNYISRGTFDLESNSIKNIENIWTGDRSPSCGNHVGGRLVIDKNNNLFVSIGDIGNPDFSQDYDEYYGKVLRMDVNGNPNNMNQWFNRGGNARYVYARGLRNPFRMYYNSDSDRLYVLDVGQNTKESIYNVKSGDNYEWPNNGI